MSLDLPKKAQIFANENLTPYNSHLAWKCCLLRRAKKNSLDLGNKWNSCNSNIRK